MAYLEKENIIYSFLRDVGVYPFCMLFALCRTAHVIQLSCCRRTATASRVAPGNVCHGDVEDPLGLLAGNGDGIEFLGK